MKKYLFKLWSDETGQSTTEYILILAVVVMITMKFKTMFEGQLTQAINSVSGSIQSAVSSNGSQ